MHIYKKNRKACLLRFSMKSISTGRLSVHMLLLIHREAVRLASWTGTGIPVTNVAAFWLACGVPSHVANDVEAKDHKIEDIQNEVDPGL